MAENGWLCCGSENGDFVAIRLDDRTENDSPSPSPGLDADVRLPISIDASTSREDSLLSLIAQARRSTKSLIAKSMRLAKDRVNCITLWFPPTDTPTTSTKGTYTEPVAILANNDRTVTLVSLRDFDHNDKIEPLDVVSYPDFVNRAIISPDGRLLVAILDDPYLYVHERVAIPTETSSSRTNTPTEYQWEQTQSFLLKSQRKDDRTDSRGSFAACFSASGAYLAVGTQHGTISIFDTTLLTVDNADPLITTFKSSRPESGPGAVRDMAFCPGPFDILAWTEDRGHVGVADMRSNFMARQIVDINTETDFEHINIFDRNTIDPRLLDGRNNRRDNASSSASGNTSAAVRREGEGFEGLNHPLTPSETMVLEAIQGDRRRRERASQRNTEDTRAVPDLTWTYMSNLRPSATETDAARTRERSSSVSRTMGNILGSYRDQRAQERVRNTRQLMRDNSERQTTTTTNATTTATTTRRPDQRWMDRLGETVAAMRDQRDRQDASYLNVLEILQARERSSNDTDHDESSLLVPLVNQVVNRWEESAIRGTLAPDHGVFEVPPSPDNTAGLTWSQDGRTL